MIINKFYLFQLTFGVMDIASSNLDVLFNWLYCIKPMCSSTSFNLIQTTILKDLLDNIIGPNDFLREQVRKYNLNLPICDLRIRIIQIFLQKQSLSSRQRQ